MDTNIQLELYKEYVSDELKKGNETNLLNFSEWRDLNAEVLQ